MGRQMQVQMHLGAVEQLLKLGRETGIYLTGGMKRAIFW